MTTRRLLTGLGLALALATTANAAGLSKGAPDIKSAGPLAFGPDGILFVGDSAGSAIFALDTGDRAAGSKAALKVDHLNRKVAEALGVEAAQITINDMAVNPASGKAYLSVSRGKGPDAAPVIARVDAAGKVEIVSLDAIPFAKAALSDSASAKADAITDIAFVDGRVFVAGLSTEEFSSRLLSIPYPFAETGKGTSIEIFHGAHGKLETKSPVRTFAAYHIKGEPYLMAAYTCTPLVKIPVAALKPGSHLKGTTIAELGNHNKPLDMIVYNKDGKDYLLLANSARGVMKIQTEGFDTAEAVTKPVKTDKQGVPYETVKGLKGVVQLDALDKDHAAILVQAADGSLGLETIDLP